MSAIQWKHQNCDDNKDAGWGCCYRSFQNAMLLHNRTVEMDDIVTSVGQWTEPAKLVRHLPPDLVGHTLLWFSVPQSLRDMRFTAPEDYTTIVPKDALMGTIRTLAKTCSFIIDNGTYAYCIVYSNGWILVDPHQDEQAHVAARLPSLEPFLRRSNLWMILAIERGDEEKLYDKETDPEQNKFAA